MIQWSPPDRAFHIEVPGKLKKIRWFGETSDSGEVKTYAVKKDGNVFVVHVLRHPEKSTEDKFGGLFFVVGGDDDHDFTERNFRLDALPAREIVYKNQSARGLFVDAGNFVIVLALAAKDRKYLDSPIANRFFSSFQLNRTISRYK